jgi:hypothetical protein
VSRLANAVIDGEPSREIVMILTVAIQQIAQRLDRHDREIIGFALRAAAADLVGPELTRPRLQ